MAKGTGVLISLGTAFAGMVFLCGGCVMLGALTGPRERPAADAAPTEEAGRADRVEQATADQAATRQLRDYLRSGFGQPGYETSWFGHIRQVSVSGGRVVVETDLYPDSDATEPASRIRGAVLGWANDRRANRDIRWVTIRGQGGHVISGERNPIR